MEQLILTKIRQFRGYAYESAGTVACFFHSPTAARACGEEIRSLADLQVEVCGTQLTVWR
jgi:hypothetical protein